LIITKQGYPIDFIQKRIAKDDSAHLYTLIYKFYSPITGYIYIIHADYHIGNIYAIKFYVKQHRRSEFKYSKITNKGDLINILISNAKIVPLILKINPTASFCFIGSRTIDHKSKKIEGIQLNQRFRIYRNIVSYIIGNKTFEHFEYTNISGYLLLNRSTPNFKNKEKEFKKMFIQTYPMLDVF
jgi:hypothetical protein